MPPWHDDDAARVLAGGAAVAGNVSGGGTSGDATGGMGHTRPVTANAHYPGPSRPAPVPGARAALPLLLALLAACSSSPERPAATAAAPRAVQVVDVAPDDPLRANDVLMRALGLVGTPYRWGGNTPDGGFDCSGLVGYVFLDAAKVYLPRTTREIAKVEARTPPRDRPARTTARRSRRPRTTRSGTRS